MTMACELCSEAGGEIIVQSQAWRVVLIDDANYPGFCRVIWQAHVKEMTDLAPADRSRLMQIVCKVEQVIRDLMQPHKINLASLGNMVPHLHWHVIPRYLDDAHFPQPIWASSDKATQDLALKRARLPQLRLALQQALAGEAA